MYAVHAVQETNIKSMQVKETAIVSVTITVSFIANATYSLEKNACSHDEAFSQTKWPCMSAQCFKPFCIIKQCWKSVTESVHNVLTLENTTIDYKNKKSYKCVYFNKKSINLLQAWSQCQGLLDIIWLPLTSTKSDFLSRLGIVSKTWWGRPRW